MAEQRGRTVRASYNGALTANSSNALILFDTDGNVYTLNASSRLIIYSAHCNPVSGFTGGGAGIDLINAPAGTTSSTNLALLLSFNSVIGTVCAADRWHAHGEGMSCKIGVTPSLLCTANGNVKFSAECVVLEYLSQSRPTQEPAVGGAAM